MAKKHKIEKETRRLIEGISDLVKKKGDRYRFKTKKKKVIKKVKRTCCHWIIRKGGKETPTTVRDPEREGYWKCTICGASFPVRPPDNINGKSAYQYTVDRTLELVNQMQFFGVRLGGDPEDTKMFLRLREYLPRFAKVSNQIVKRLNKRDEFEKRKKDGQAMSQFDYYAGFNYRS